METFETLRLSPLSPLNFNVNSYSLRHDGIESKNLQQLCWRRESAGILNILSPTESDSVSASLRKSDEIRRHGSLVLGLCQ